MSKPIGFFCSYTPGDGGLLGEMEESWGSSFEELTQSEKLWLLATITGVMTADKSTHYNPNSVSDAIVPACERLHELSYSDQLGLAEALIHQLRY